MAVKDTILWLGTVADDQIVLGSSAASPAANRWQRGLISALADIGISIRIVGHWPEPAFPKGPLFVSKKTETECCMLKTVGNKWVSYTNAPFIRARSLENGYASAIRELMPLCVDRLLGVVSYNAYNVGRKIKEDVFNGTRIPWVPIVADSDGSARGRERLYRELAHADGAIVLSWGLAKAWHACPVLHLDGGVESGRVCDNLSVQSSERTLYPFLYCGATNKWAGIDLLAAAFEGWPEQRARLWLCGKGAVVERFPLLMKDARVKCFGAVSDDQLDVLASQCYALVNPRPTDLLDNQMNFPSKVLEYLRYGKPVVSTWTEGLDPDYRSMLTVAHGGTVQSLRNAMAETMTWTADDLRRQGEETRQFLLNNRNWERQARRMKKFLEMIGVR
jgi:glycosyltransferase involved in cell wall biosynthesis